MHNNITIERKIDELNKEVFSFFDDGYILYLDTYCLFNRESKSHSFKKVKWYERLRQRESNIQENEVILSEDIKQRAINEVISRLQVKYWSEKF